MPKTKISRKNLFVILILLVFSFSHIGLSQEKRAMTFEDVMKFRAIDDPVISENGQWIAFAAQPDRGDGEVIVQEIRGENRFIISRGQKPVFTKNSRWLASVVKAKAVDLEKEGKDKPKSGMALLEIGSGEVTPFEKVERFSFSDDSAWMAFLHFKEEDKAEEKGKEKPHTAIEEKPVAQTKKVKMKDIGSVLVLRHLASGTEVSVPFVQDSAFDSQSKYIVYSVANPEGMENGIFYRELGREGSTAGIILKAERSSSKNIVWTKDGNKMAFLSGIQDETGILGPSSLWQWDSRMRRAIQAVKAEDLPSGWVIPGKNKLTWSEDGKRLFFGLMPKKMFDLIKEKEETNKKEEAVDLFDLGRILEKKEVDVWHWNDPLIIPHQKKTWQETKDNTYLAVYHVDTNQFLPLADDELPVVEPADNSRIVLGLSNVPYLKEITWDGRFHDVLAVDLKTGVRNKVFSRLSGRPFLSPGGNFILFYHDRNWHLYDTKLKTTRNLTASLKVPFSDEDNDTPDEPPGYGMGGWVEGDSAVLIYDKFDIWQFATATGKPLCLTEGYGRKNNLTFRILKFDPDEKSLGKSQKLFLSAYHNMEKHRGFSSGRVGTPRVTKILEEKKRYTFLAKAKKADILMYTRESYEEFPDIWVSDSGFSAPRKLTDLNPQTAEFAWGSAELIEWQSLDGIPLQGVLIKPGNYEPGKRYPVLVYFYEMFSQRLYEFNQVVINHRPCFPFYASNGYVLFLPDIRYEIGRPGFSATKCLVPGVQKLIDMGVADPKAIALHGHSWSGYQTAFIITQTNMFAAAIAGAAVSNMTSAYGGIRWESGFARPFQYEKSQSRIGGSLWEFPERYIENSPLFFTDRIQTPLLLMFGDEDGAVPWYQGIELYLAMRRLGKDCVFLQYRGEPHHPQKYPNKLDYSIKMKEYLDHYLKGKPAPDWISQGIPYSGK